MTESIEPIIHLTDKITTEKSEKIRCLGPIPIRQGVFAMLTSTIIVHLIFLALLFFLLAVLQTPTPEKADMIINSNFRKAFDLDGDYEMNHVISIALTWVYISISTTILRIFSYTVGLVSAIKRIVPIFYRWNVVNICMLFATWAEIITLAVSGRADIFQIICNVFGIYVAYICWQYRNIIGHERVTSEVDKVSV